tara:strand:- start:126 stop:287 length:162 start_codon:yes stop_codon:yes gene_type:complete
MDSFKQRTKININFEVKWEGDILHYKAIIEKAAKLLKYKPLTVFVKDSRALWK